ncbi:MAG: nickel-responsive transcriptional regulator NikR [Nitrospinae bacterium]|nr:nickel-responsive transcriptional regulator NikR [Nitrospinota bacterium]
MSEIGRLSFTIEKALSGKLEKLVKESGYANRSEFIRDLIRSRLVEKEWELNEEAVGTVTLVYDHHARQLSNKLTQLQHDHHEAVLAATHVHLSHHICAEMIMIKGRAAMIKSIADKLRRQKGVLHVELSMSSTGEKLK